MRATVVHSVNITFCSMQHPGVVRPGEFQLGAPRAAARSFGPPCCTARPSPSAFLKRSQRSTSAPTLIQHQRHNQKKQKPPVPPRHAPLPQRHAPPDFVRSNVKAAAAVVRPPLPPLARYVLKPTFGRVPAYLVQRNAAAKVAAQAEAQWRLQQRDEVNIV